MVLKEQELLQIDEKFIQNLLKKDPDALASLSIRLTNDLKEAVERLNQNPNNSSRPSGSLAPWDKSSSSSTDDHEIEADPTPAEEDNKENTDHDRLTKNKNDQPSNTSQSKLKPGKQPGSQGYGRTQKLQVTDIKHHHCHHCPVCREELGSVEKAYTGFYSVNIEYGDVDTPGIQLTNTHHLYYSALCPNCGLQSRSEPVRAPANETDWDKVGMTEWRLVGADLAALIVYLLMDMYLTRRKVQRLLYDVFGLKLSIGTIQNCVIESGRAIAPVEEQLVEELLGDSLMHADETSHKEAGALLWLWVFITSSTALFLIGYRSKEILTNLLDSFESGFDGWLMSDGYCIYRDHPKRLRCWAHLTRKARGLKECFSKTSRSYGRQVDVIMESLMNAIYSAREGPDEGKASIADNHREQLEHLKEICLEMSASSHNKTHALGTEFLNDWEAIFRILDYPAWPITNNEAERALRHWVILRKITQGTRSEQGSRALALFASVIATCRLRNASPLLYIRDVIKLRRQGDDVPKLPLMPVQTLTV
jgi:IS1 family transposase